MAFGERGSRPTLFHVKSRARFRTVAAPSYLLSGRVARDGMLSSSKTKRSAGQKHHRDPLRDMRRLVVSMTFSGSLWPVALTGDRKGFLNMPLFLILVDDGGPLAYKRSLRVVSKTQFPTTSHLIPQSTHTSTCTPTTHLHLKPQAYEHMQAS